MVSIKRLLFGSDVEQSFKRALRRAARDAKRAGLASFDLPAVPRPISSRIARAIVWYAPTQIENILDDHTLARDEIRNFERAVIRQIMLHLEHARIYNKPVFQSLLRVILRLYPELGEEGGRHIRRLLTYTCWILEEQIKFEERTLRSTYQPDPEDHEKIWHLRNTQAILARELVHVPNLGVEECTFFFKNREQLLDPQAQKVLLRQPHLTHEQFHALIVSDSTGEFLKEACALSRTYVAQKTANYLWICCDRSSDMLRTVISRIPAEVSDRLLQYLLGRHEPERERLISYCLQTRPDIARSLRVSDIDQLVRAAWSRPDILAEWIDKLSGIPHEILARVLCHPDHNVRLRAICKVPRDSEHERHAPGNSLARDRKFILHTPQK